MGVRRVVPDLSSTSLEAAKGFCGDLLGLRPVMDHGWIVTLADPTERRLGARLSRAAAPSAIPAAAEQAGGRAECLCIASARVLARFCR
jgi:hypothetical protein